MPKLLEKEMIKHESKSAIRFRHWIKANPQFSCAIENKDTRGKNVLAFSEISQVQLDYGMAIKGPNGVLIRTTGGEGIPDYVYLRNAPAWIVIKYPRSFEIIDVETFIMERKRSKEKSLSSTRAKEISTISVPLKVV